MATAWVFAETVEGELNPGALELTTKARSLGDVSVFLVGAGSDDAFSALGEHGATSVHHLDPGDALPSSAAATALAELLASNGGDVVLFGPGTTDRDVAGRLSAKTGYPVLANALDIEVGDGVKAISEILGGTMSITTAATSAGPALVTTRPKAFAAEPSGGGAPTVSAVSMPDTRSGSWVSTVGATTWFRTSPLAL